MIQQWGEAMSDQCVSQLPAVRSKYQVSVASAVEGEVGADAGPGEALGDHAGDDGNEGPQEPPAQASPPTEAQVGPISDEFLLAASAEASPTLDWLMPLFGDLQGSASVAKKLHSIVSARAVSMGLEFQKDFAGAIDLIVSRVGAFRDMVLVLKAGDLLCDSSAFDYAVGLAEWSEWKGLKADDLAARKLPKLQIMVSATIAAERLNKHIEKSDTTECRSNGIDSLAIGQAFFPILQRKVSSWVGSSMQSVTATLHTHALALQSASDIEQLSHDGQLKSALALLTNDPDGKMALTIRNKIKVLREASGGGMLTLLKEKDLKWGHMDSIKMAKKMLELLLASLEARCVGDGASRILPRGWGRGIGKSPPSQARANHRFGVGEHRSHGNQHIGGKSHCNFRGVCGWGRGWGVIRRITCLCNVARHVLFATPFQALVGTIAPSWVGMSDLISRLGHELIIGYCSLYVFACGRMYCCFVRRPLLHMRGNCSRTLSAKLCGGTLLRRRPSQGEFFRLHLGASRNNSSGYPPRADGQTISNTLACPGHLHTFAKSPRIGND